MQVENMQTALVIPVVMVLLRAVKATPGIPDWLIPILAMILGSVGNCIVNGFNAPTALAGVLLGASVVGLHQGVKQPYVNLLTNRPGDGDGGGNRGGQGKSLLKPGWYRFQAFMVVPLLMVAVIGLTPGCATSGGGGSGGAQSTTTLTSTSTTLDQARKTAVVVETSAQLGTYFAVKKDANARAYFEAAVVVIDALIKDGVVDPVRLRSSLDGISVKELKSDEARAGIEAALTLYQVFLGERVSGQVNANAMASEILKGLSNGISKGLLTVPTEKKYGLKRE